MSTTIFEYALGSAHLSGVSIITGENAGFRGMERPLTKGELKDVLVAMLKVDDDERLLDQCKVNFVIDTIHKAHLSMFAEHLENS